MNLIVAADSCWGIGYRGQLLVSIPEDQRMFREETVGKVIVMGRKTLESLPGGRALPGRTNLVLTRDLDFQAKGAVVCHSMEEALEVLAGYVQEDIFVIGGEEIYRQFLPYCSVAHVTRIDYQYQADTFFTDLDESSDWRLVLESEEKTYFDLCYTFCMYVRDGRMD